MKVNMHPLKELKGKEKLQYLVDYYKFHFILGCILVCVLFYSLHSFFSKKNNTLYIALANVTSNDAFRKELTIDYLKYRNKNIKNEQIYLYENLFLSKNPSDEKAQYEFLSEAKLLSAINSQHLDLIIMDQNAFNILRENNYLSDLSPFLSESILTEEESVYSVNVSDISFSDVQYNDTPIYIGMIDNSPRKDEAIQFINYLLGSK